MLLTQPDISLLLTRVQDALHGGQVVWVSGPVGSGRTTLARQVAQNLDNAVLIDLPALDEPDAGAAVSLFALGALERPDRVSLLHASTQEILRRLGELDVPVVVRLPDGWARNQTALHGKARDELAALSSLRSVAWIAGAGLRPAQVGAQPEIELRLPVHKRPLPIEGWETYGEASEALRAASLAGQTASPLVWRLAVGAVALGASAQTVASWCAAPQPRALKRVWKLLEDRLGYHREASAAVQRFARVRTEVPREVALAVGQPPAGHEALITQCIGYGDPVRISPSLRPNLRPKRSARTPGGHALEESHERLARHYESLDGASSPADLKGWHAVGAWLEKVHHFAHAGARCAEAWSSQRLPRPELYWDRARYYSAERKDYAEAARIYRSCQERFPNDDYSLHYLAYNLDKLHGPTTEVRGLYQSAVDRVDRNLWWNARNITALISAKRPIEAYRAWVEALERIDPDGTRVEDDAWIAAHFHFWVANAWLEKGNWCQARSVLDSLPEGALERAAVHRPAFPALRTKVETLGRRERKRFGGWLRRRARRDPAWSSATALWAHLRKRFDGMPPPIASDGEDGPRFAWSHPGVFLELEMVGDEQVDWYGRDRLSSVRGGSDEPSAWSDAELAVWLERVSRG